MRPILRIRWKMLSRHLKPTLHQELFAQMHSSGYLFSCNHFIALLYLFFIELTYFYLLAQITLYIWQGKALTRAGTRSSSSTRGRWQRVNKLCRICEYDDEQHVNAGSNFTFGPFCCVSSKQEFGVWLQERSAIKYDRDVIRYLYVSLRRSTDLVFLFSVYIFYLFVFLSLIFASCQKCAIFTCTHIRRSYYIYL